MSGGAYDAILVPTKDSFALHHAPRHVGWLQRCPRCCRLKAYVERITGITVPWRERGNSGVPQSVESEMAGQRTTDTSHD